MAKLFQLDLRSTGTTGFSTHLPLAPTGFAIRAGSSDGFTETIQYALGVSEAAAGKRNRVRFKSHYQE